MRTIPSRQVHLDFHTSEWITGIGKRFDRKQYQEALLTGHVNSVTTFAKCHHGMSYYPTTVGTMHPGLSFDFLKAQIDACHEIGVACPVYITVGWSSTEAATHPEWCVRDKEGRINNYNVNPEARPEDPRPACSWNFLCPSGNYLTLLLRQTEEICDGYNVDGLFYDICNNAPCYCDTCRAGMTAEGMDLSDTWGAVMAYSTRKWRFFFESCRRILLTRHPEATLFFNGTVHLGGSAATGSKEGGAALHHLNTHQELEDLPTTWGGYDKLPIRARHFARDGHRLIGMSGKFHTSWGEFGGFKHPEAIRLEAASMIAQGAGCSFGDQMHPSGEMDRETYRCIGEAYAYVESIEAYGAGARVASNLGLWRSGSNAHDEGVSVMLLETQREFDSVGAEDDFSRYEVIILPGSPSLTEPLAAKFTTYVKNGGKLLVLGAGALNADRSRMLLDLGVTYTGAATCDVDYLLAGEVLAVNAVRTPVLSYEPAIRTQAGDGVTILAMIREPYFNRTYEKYCSHQNTPYRLENAAHPGAVRKGNVIFLAHPLDKMYLEHGARVHRTFFTNALNLLQMRPMSQTVMPSAGRMTFLHQPEENRYVAHLTYAPPLRRGRCLVIEDLVPLYNVPLTVRIPKAVRKAVLIPSLEVLPLTREGDAQHLTIPVVQCHAAVALYY